MRAVLSSLLALALGAACALLVACGGGGDDADLIPSGAAGELIGQLDRLEQSVQAGDCERVGGDIDRLQTAVNGLPNRVDARLRQRLDEGVANLAQIAPDECLDQAQSTDTTETGTTETEPPADTTETEPPPDTTETEPPPDTTETEPPPDTTETEPPPTTTETEPPVETVPPETPGGGATSPSGGGAGDGGSAGGASGTGGATPTP